MYAAECAFATENIKISRELVEKYLLYSPQKDQYYCRSKLLLGQIIVEESQNLHGEKLLKRSSEAVSEMLTALEIATENRGRYDFLVYNVSLRLYELVRPFLRKGVAARFASDMQKVSTALLVLPQADKDWNVTFLSACAYCLNDAKQLSATAEALDTAIQVAEELLTEASAAENEAIAESRANTKMIDEIHKEMHVAESEDSSSERLRSLSDKLASYQRLSGDLKAKCLVLAERTQPLADRVCRLYLQRIHMNPGDAKKVLSAPQVSTSLRNKCLATMHSLVVTSANEQEKNTLVASLFSELSSAAPSVVTVETLLDCSRLAWSLQVCDLARKLAQKAADLIREHSLVAPVLMVKQDLTSALFLVADAGDVTPSEDEIKLLTAKQQQGQVAHKRLEAAKLLERVLSVCQTRLRDSALTQEICVVIWNAILPLLQSHLRKHIYRPLQLIAAALTDIGSPMLLLRTQVHLELAKCEEQFDFVVKAHTESAKALTLDYGTHKQQAMPESTPASKQLAKATTRQLSAAAPDSAPVAVEQTPGRCDYEQERQLDIHIDVMNSNLQLRSNVYETPDTAEDQVELNLQQIKESSSKKYRLDMITKSASMMFEALVRGGEEENVAVRAIQSGATVPLPLLQLALEEDKCSSALQPHDFSEIRKPVLQRVRIMMNIAIFAHASQAQYRSSHSTVFARNDSSSIVQKCLLYVLSQTWDYSDPMIRTYIVQQVDAMCMLAESVVDRMNCIEVTDDDWIEVRDRKGMRPPLSSEEEAAMDASNTRDDLDIDPRALGIKGELTNRPDETDAMMHIKTIVLLALTKALLLGAALEDAIAVQNVLIYFWNMHLHIFRGNLYALAMQEVHDFLHAAAEALDKLSKSATRTAAPVDEKLRLMILEAHAMSLVASDSLQNAIEVTAKACAISRCPAYHRKRCAELLCRLQLLTGSSGTGAKGKAGDGSLPKFDDAFLNVFAIIVTVEADTTPDEIKRQNIAKAVIAIDAEVSRQIKDMNLCVLSREARDQLQEMIVEAYTRLTRANIKLGNIHSANDTAEKCLRVVSDGIAAFAVEKPRPSPDDQSPSSAVHKRVWRWASLCERFFGKAIAQLIKSDGQDLTLQLQLRIAALRHFTIGCKFGVNASIDHLVELTSVDAWNVAMPLLEHLSSNNDDLVSSLISLFVQVIESLLQCESSPKISLLKQQFYLALIEIHAELGDWSAAMETVMSAFDNMPSDLQKPLWKWRVIVMSKRGKNVLDGLQKLKENDPTLQARVYAILARSAAKRSTQHEAYRKALDILKDDISRADYALETAQWMATNGFAKSAIADTIRLALDAISEVDDVIMEDTISESQSATSSRHTSRRTMRKSVRSSTTKSHQSRRRKSRSERSLDALQGERAPGLTLANFDQALRGKAMLAMMAVTEADRTQHCLDAMQYVNRSLKKWQDTLTALGMTLAAAASPPSAEPASAIEDDASRSPSAAPAYTKIPDDLLDFISWQPTNELLSLMKQGRLSTSSVNIPCEESLQFMPLTVAALTFIAESLEKMGYCKTALQCLAWARVCVLFTEDVENSKYVHLRLHFMLLKMLSCCNISCVKPASTLGIAGSSPADTFAELVSHVSAMRLGDVSDCEITAEHGIPAWTQRLESHDVVSCALSLSRIFIELGMTPYATQVARRLQQSAANTSSRVYAEASLILSRISLQCGDFNTAVSTSLSLSHVVAKFNDALLLQEHSCIMIKALVGLHRAQDAASVAADTLALLETAVIRRVPADANSSSSSTASLHAKTTLTRTSISALRGEYGGGDSSIEMDYTAVEAFLTVTHVLAEQLLVPQSCERTIQQKKQKKQLSPSVIEDDLTSGISNAYERCASLISKVVGKSSLLLASCVIQQAQCQAEVYLHYHKFCSSTLQLAVDTYSSWIVERLSEQISLAERAHSILLELKEHLGTAETAFGTVNTASSPIARNLTSVQLFISYILLLYPLLHNKHAPPIDFDASAVTEHYTVIDQYLDATSSAAKPAALSDMLQECLDKSGDFAEALRSDCFGAAGALSAASQLLKEMVRTGNECSVWRQPSSDEQGTITAAASVEAPLPTASIDASASVDVTSPAPSPLHVTSAPVVCQNIKKHIELGHGLVSSDASVLGCMAVADAIGVTAPAKSAGWLLTAQSVRSREYLMSMWRDSLNSQSEVAVTINRMQQMVLACNAGCKSSIAKLEADAQLLQHSCPAWNR